MQAQGETQEKRSRGEGLRERCTELGARDSAGRLVRFAFWKDDQREGSEDGGGGQKPEHWKISLCVSMPWTQHTRARLS